ncbi:MAG: SMC-Scp complex subunit ScpB [Ruminococcaceae bacterium]|nr:SMC-Scp complex subunit ScpB [Oscillospiraceae bacterium]
MVEQNSAPTLSKSQQRQALEAILFAAGYPVPYTKLAEALDMPPSKVKKFALEWQEEYNEAPERGIMLLCFEDTCQLCSKEQYKDQIRIAMGIRSSGKLSASCMEVLAIVAYNQPVTKAFIETVRGVDCSYAVSSLLDKSLIEAKGRLDAPGKPILYGTTADFLRCFGIDSLSALPNRAEFQGGLSGKAMQYIEEQKGEGENEAEA